jgi:asparagine synthase (glutamine-hydrolysing)
MCGIAGIFKTNGQAVQETELANMQHALRHRGPDGKGSFHADAFGMIHTRLSIIDLSEKGDQPFFSPDKNVTVIVNGEIYNFQKIREELIAEGVVFHSESDCEIIPHLYLKHGKNFVEKIEGMFAIALWDEAKKTLLLYRDRFGIKPVYYSKQPNCFYFGSEIKSILCHQHFPLTVDVQAIHDFLSLAYVPEPATGFNEVSVLLPGHFIEISPNHFGITRYWQLQNKPTAYANDEAALNALENEIASAVKFQKIADAPLGAFLSGGIDSSTVVCHLAKANGKEPIKTFTVKFPDVDFDESSYAQRISDILKTNHYQFELKEGEGDPLLIEKLLTHFDQPFADSSCIPTYLISKEIQSRVKVALSGDGGDEVMAGYPNFWYFERIKKLRRIPKFARSIAKGIIGLAPIGVDKKRQFSKVLELASLNDEELLFRLCAYQSEEQKKDFYTDAHAFKNCASASRLFKWDAGFETEDVYQQITRVMLRTSLTGDMLKKVDMMSMLSAIEVRVPLLHESYVERAFALPPSMKMEKQKGKLALRTLLKRHLPEDIVEKRKTGFAIPLDKMVNKEMIAFIEEKLLSANTRITRFIKKEVIQQWVTSFVGTSQIRSDISREGLYQRIFMLLSLEIWMRKNDLWIN